MADAELEAEGGHREGGGGARPAPPGPNGRAARVAPLAPEQLRQVLEQVTKAQPRAGPPPPPPPPFVLQDAARRLRDAAQLAALQRGPGAQPPRPPRLLPPQQLEAICIKAPSAEAKGPERPVALLSTVHPPSQAPGRVSGLCPRQPFLSAASCSPQPPIRLLLPGPLPALQPGPARRVVAPKAPAGPGPAAATSCPPAAPPGPSGAAGAPSSGPRGPEPLRKSLRVKTRSGRVSRPPRHKAKDYRFLRTEALAEGRPSDSDDYSELSAEDEAEAPGGWQALFEAASCALRPRTFACQTCGKAYLGRGGLARHFRLLPGHGPPDPEVPRAQGAGGSRTQGPPEPSTPAPRREEEARPAPGGLQQRDPASPAAPALPTLAQAVTVYEFLLMKAGAGHPGKPFFPAVYREFEELHGRVKALCRDYLGGGGPGPGSLELLQITDSKLAESLGILEGPPRTVAPGDCSAPHPTSPPRQELEAARAPRRETPGEAPASVKRARSGALPPDSAASGCPEPASWAPAASEGPAPPAAAGTLRTWALDPEDGCAGPRPPGSPPREDPASPRPKAPGRAAGPGPPGRGVCGPGRQAWGHASPQDAQGIAQGSGRNSGDWQGRPLVAAGGGALSRPCPAWPGVALPMDTGPAEQASSAGLEPGPQLPAADHLGAQEGDADATEPSAPERAVAEGLAAGPGAAGELSSRAEERALTPTFGALMTVVPHPGSVAPGDVALVAGGLGAALLEGLPWRRESSALQ